MVDDEFHISLCEETRDEDNVDQRVNIDGQVNAKPIDIDIDALNNKTDFLFSFIHSVYRCQWALC